MKPLDLGSPDLLFRDNGWTEQELMEELEALSAYADEGSKNNLFTASLELIKRRDARIKLLLQNVDELHDKLRKNVYDVYPEFKKDYEFLEQERQIVTDELARTTRLLEAYKKIAKGAFKQNKED